MEHQDWNPIVLNTKKEFENKSNKKDKEKEKSNYVPPPETIKMEAPKNLGQLICQGRAAKSKTQKQLAAELGISPSVLSRWETNKELPNNGQIAQIEKTLGIKLPRAKKTKVDPN
jgi:ribosome-binding protein aMBF1 (putative translation factor)